MKGLRCKSYYETYTWGSSRYQFIKGKISNFKVKLWISSRDAQEYINKYDTATAATSGALFLGYASDSDTTAGKIGQIAGGLGAIAGGVAQANYARQAEEIHEELAYNVIKYLLENEDEFTSAINKGLGSNKVYLESAELEFSSVDGCSIVIQCALVN